MKLRYYPDPVLRNRCLQCDNDFKTKDKRILVKKMLDIADNNDGIGLSAPQVGLSIRMFVWRQNARDQFGQSIFDPVLSCVSGSVNSVEGCLSLPNILVTKKRATSSILSGFGINGKRLKFTGNENTTRIWQHEIDHLDGKLIIDDMSPKDCINNRDSIRTLLNNVVA